MITWSETSPSESIFCVFIRSFGIIGWGYKEPHRSQLASLRQFHPNLIRRTEVNSLTWCQDSYTFCLRVEVLAIPLRCFIYIMQMRRHICKYTHNWPKSLGHHLIKVNLGDGKSIFLEVLRFPPFSHRIGDMLLKRRVGPCQRLPRRRNVIGIDWVRIPDDDAHRQGIVLKSHGHVSGAHFRYLQRWPKRIRAKWH